MCTKKGLSVAILMLSFAIPAAAAPEEPSAFADWFIAQEFEGQEYYKWAAIFRALTDGIDRTRTAHGEVVNPVYVAILSGTKYHVNESCSALKNASTVLELDRAEAVERGFEICTMCRTEEDGYVH